MARLFVTLACTAALFTVPAHGDEDVSDSRRFTTATYRVAVEKQDQFLALLKGAEQEMRELGLITNRPIIRMRSLEDRRLLLEIFEWSDSTAFERAQKEPRILVWWGKFEALWEEGGFGLSKFPEAQQPWARFEPID